MTQSILWSALGNVVLAIWIVYRLFRPYRCECGFSTPIWMHFRRHIKAKHGMK
jgi:hypothetical protein